MATTMLAKLPFYGRSRGRCRDRTRWRLLAVKKMLVLVLLGLGAFAVWRKVQADRAELDLWTEATAIDQD
jgi:hypothetical protein